VTPADSLGELPKRESLISGGDVAMAIGATAGVAMLGLLDRHVAMEVTESNSGFAQGLARGAERGGNPAMILPLLGVTWVAGKVSGHPGVSSSSLRIAGGMFATAGVATGLKIVAGRSRPYQAPGDPDEFKAFSGNTSFPSGHTSIAFSLASGIDHETTAHWVPFVVYPLAGMVGWSRLRDNKHWASDVLAGALVGTWTTHKFQVLVRGNKPQSAVTFEIAPGAAAATWRF
jgi:membrane-associated phospholipid phosphatase